MKHPLHASGHRGPFDSAVHRLDGRVKLLGTLAAVIVVVTTPADRYLAFACYAALLAGALAAARVPAGYVLARWLIVLPFVAAAAAVPFLPAAGPAYQVGGVRIYQAGLTVMASVAIKSTLAVTAMTLLAGSTHFADLLKSIERLKAPRVAVMTIGLTYRYLFLLADEAIRMKRARDLRHYGGRWLWQAGVVGRMVGTLLLRSFERAERVHAAMLARGFDGTAVSGHPMRVRLADGLALAGWVGALIVARLVAA